MDCIKLLPEIVANQIAAGEVVNAPSNVVKEMMENALDAGAECVRVNFRNGGKDLIQIVDDGCGMSALDARMAFDRHATSKIRSVEDIYRLHTFGFRGEALAAIASVSDIRIISKTAEAAYGTALEAHAGEIVSLCEQGATTGTYSTQLILFLSQPILILQVTGFETASTIALVTL